MNTASLLIPYLEPDEVRKIIGDLSPTPCDHSWWRQIPLGTERAVALSIRIEQLGSVEWARILSLDTGGFCMLRQSGGTPPLAFYCGDPLEVDAGSTWEEWYNALCGLTWYPELAEPEGEVRLSGPMAPMTPRQTWTRVTFAALEGPAFVRAAAEASAAGLLVSGWRWLERRTALANIGFVMMDRGGPFDVELLGYLAKTLGVYGAALEFHVGSPARNWWLDSTGLLQSDDSGSASTVIGLCSELCITMGEGGGQLRWPRRESGQLL